MPIYLLHGDAKSVDSFKVRARLDELLKGIPRDGNINFSAFDLGASGTSFHDVVSSALTVPFLGSNRTVVAKNVKAVEKRFFAPKEKQTTDSDESQEEQEDLSNDAEAVLRSLKQLSDLPKEALLVFVEENDHLDKRTRFFKALDKVGCKAESFKGMWFDPASGRDRDMKDAVEFVQSQASRLGLRLSAGQAKDFAILVGSDSGTIVRELEKLVLYAGKGAKVASEEIESVVTKSYEAGIFQLVDLIGKGQTGKAIEALGDLLDHGAKEPYILAMIARQVRLIARVREALASGKGFDELPSVLGEGTFVIGKVNEQARVFPRIDYPVILEYLMETDVHLKRGTMPPRLALEMLITKLAVRRG